MASCMSPWGAVAAGCAATCVPPVPGMRSDWPAWTCVSGLMPFSVAIEMWDTLYVRARE